MILNEMQNLQRSQEPMKKICKQQNKQNAEVRLRVLREFPHLKDRYEKAIIENKQETDSYINNVNRFFELSSTMLDDYLSLPHTLYESPCQHIISSGKLEKSVLTEYTCNLCLLKFYNLAQAEWHCKMTEPDKHKQAMSTKICRSGSDLLTEINQKYESDICEFASIVAERVDK